MLRLTSGVCYAFALPPALVFGCVRDVQTESAASFSLASGQTWDGVPDKVEKWQGKAPSSFSRQAISGCPPKRSGNKTQAAFRVASYGLCHRAPETVGAGACIRPRHQRTDSRFKGSFWGRRSTWRCDVKYVCIAVVAMMTVLFSTEPVPPQNSVDRTIVDVSAFGVKLPYPDASLAVRPARDHQIEPEAAARTRSAKSLDPTRCRA